MSEDSKLLFVWALLLFKQFLFALNSILSQLNKDITDYVLAVNFVMPGNIVIDSQTGKELSIPFSIPSGYKKAIMATMQTSSWGGITASAVTLGNNFVALNLYNGTLSSRTINPSVTVLFSK